ncbi:hypothetical protein DB88DRAFT_486353 [Papiliotrema laurentii]|uniref:DNA-directed RNA polymerase III subunit RPC9 n=1 Tax=Papiliotrema laurentii TaxID=5418 RepID=A0AAD9L5T0_PAPLA|nr:hypothetical protein DB88DRAFT_486353 [Papiliotrema laurentii]
MKFSNTAPYHLSNYEVLNHFLALKADNDELQELQARYKKRNDAFLKKKYPIPEDDLDEDGKPMRRNRKGKKAAVQEEEEEIVTEEESRREQIAVRRGISDELVWMTDSVINYICSDLCQTSRQSPEGIEQLIHSLQRRDLVKAEVLQIVNLAPSDAAELYCVIEDAETRFGYETNDVLDAVRADVASSLLPEAPEHLQHYVSAAQTAGVGSGHGAAYYEGDEEEYGHEELDQFVHEAEWGAGKEVGVGDEEEDPME